MCKFITTNMEKRQSNLAFVRFVVIVATSASLYAVCLLDLDISMLFDLPYVSAQDTYGNDAKFEKMWEGRDAFDDIMAKFTAVDADTCSIAHVGDLKMPEDTVSHIPDIKEINLNPVFPNRTALLHLHNMALNRAFFFSYILQSRYNDGRLLIKVAR